MSGVWIVVAAGAVARAGVRIVCWWRGGWGKETTMWRGAWRKIVDELAVRMQEYLVVGLVTMVVGAAVFSVAAIVLSETEMKRYMESWWVIGGMLAATWLLAGWWLRRK